MVVALPTDVRTYRAGGNEGARALDNTLMIPPSLPFLLRPTQQPLPLLLSLPCPNAHRSRPVLRGPIQHRRPPAPTDRGRRRQSPDSLPPCTNSSSRWLGRRADATERKDGLVGLPPSPLLWAGGGGTLSPFSSFSLLVINVCYHRPNQAEKRTPKRCCQDTPRPREVEGERAADKRTHTFGQVFERVRWFLPLPLPPYLWRATAPPLPVRIRPKVTRVRSSFGACARKDPSPGERERKEGDSEVGIRA